MHKLRPYVLKTHTHIAHSQIIHTRTLPTVGIKQHVVTTLTKE